MVRPRNPLLTSDAGTELLPDFPPGWATGQGAQTPDEEWFLAGAALAALHPVAMGQRPAVPLALLADRLAFAAAEASLRILGRPETLGALRDAVHLLRPGEAPGPAGAVALAWRRAGTAPVPREGRGAASPLGAAAAALERGLGEGPGDSVAALIAAETALAAALGWPVVLPMIAPAMRRRDLTARGDALALACARAVTVAAPRAQGLAIDLARRATGLRAVAPKLRSKGADAAVALILATDAVAPSLALAPRVRGTAVPLSDRAARRLCERLEALGALRELTGRASFRLYGL